jgi:hypothetical protein
MTRQLLSSDVGTDAGVGGIRVRSPQQENFAFTRQWDEIIETVDIDFKISPGHHWLLRPMQFVS